MIVVSIGCNDGMDDCRQFVFENLLKIESLHLIDSSPAALEQCRETYRRVAQARFHHLAIVPDARTRVVMHAPAGQPMSQHISVRPEHLSAHGHASVESFEVPAMRFKDFLQTQGIARCSRLYMDTEGLDCQIILGMDLADDAPDFIQYEKTHADGPFHHGAIYRACVEKLQDAGYQIRPASYGNEAAERFLT